MKKLIHQAENIYYNQHMSTTEEEDQSNYLSKLIIVQRAVRKFLNIINKKRTTNMFSEDFNKNFFSNIKLEKINELKQRIMNKIKTNHLGYKSNDMNFQDVINSYIIKILDLE